MKINRTSSAFTLIELLVVIAIIAVLASIALPAFTAVQERGKQTKDMSNGKQIALALKQFATDHNGTFPNKEPAADYDTAPNALAAGDHSNDAFWWLFPNYVTSEDIFSVGGSAWCPNPPDNKLDAPGSNQRTLTLGQGECGYTYITALNDTANPQFPLVTDAGNPGGNVDQTYTNVQSSKGGIWKGKKAVMIFVDGSGQVMVCNNQANQVQTAVNRAGHPYNITNNAQNDPNDPWLTAANLRLQPDTP